MPLTITEALAEIKTVEKRLEKKRAAVLQYVARQDGVRDPMEKEGGSAEFIARERQAIADLGQRVVELRRGIARANDGTEITVGGATRPITDWLHWRREVAPGDQAFLGQLRNQVNAARVQAQRNGSAVVAPGGLAEKPTDIIVNVSEKGLSDEIEALEEVLGTLDGQLSLKNATVMIDA